MHWLQWTNSPVQNSRRKSSGGPSLGPVANPQLGSWIDSSPGTSHTGGAFTARGEESEGEEVAGQSHVRMSAIDWTARVLLSLVGFQYTRGLLLQGLAEGLPCDGRNVGFGAEVQRECNSPHPYLGMGLSFHLGLFSLTTETVTMPSSWSSRGDQVR